MLNPRDKLRTWKKKNQVKHVVFLLYSTLALAWSAFCTGLVVRTQLLLCGIWLACACRWHDRRYEHLAQGRIWVVIGITNAKGFKESGNQSVYHYSDSTLFCSRLCPSIAGNSPQTFSVLCYPCPCCSLLLHSIICPRELWSSFWPCALCYVPFCTSVVFHLGDVPSPPPFHFCDVFCYVCHLGLMTVCFRFCLCLTFSLFLSIVNWLVLSFFTINWFCWRPCLVCHFGKTPCLKTLFLTDGRCFSSKISL